MVLYGIIIHHWKNIRRILHFLVAYTRLYKSLCRSVGWLVRPSVTLLKFLPKSYLNRINAPAHPYATDAVVYTALFWF